MSEDQIEANNPYACPASNPDLSQSGINDKLVRGFRRQIHVLGGLWILLGGSSLAVPNDFIIGGGWGIDELAGPLIRIALGGAFLLLGIQACRKRLAAVQAGLVILYLSMILNALTGYSIAIASDFSTVVLIMVLISLFLIVLACSVISKGKKLQRAGVPLNYKP